MTPLGEDQLISLLSRIYLFCCCDCQKHQRIDKKYQKMVNWFVDYAETHIYLCLKWQHASMEIADDVLLTTSAT